VGPLVADLRVAPCVDTGTLVSILSYLILSYLILSVDAFAVALFLPSFPRAAPPVRAPPTHTERARSSGVRRCAHRSPGRSS
jgi:hypothetical protein